MKELIKDYWNQNNISDFYNILEDFKNIDRVDFTKKVVNTKKECLAVKSVDLKIMADEIFKGNYLSFLDIMPNKNHESLIVCDYVISKIKDFKLQKKYILKMAKYIDNWAVVDSLKFSIKKQEDEYITFSKKLTNNNKKFYRRIGVRILFGFTKNYTYTDEIFKIIDSLYYEDKYYVNMAVSWLLCEMFIYNRDKTLKYVKHSNINKFTFNKFVDKCCDSFRIADSDKKLLKSMRKARKF